jgi:hypothetical protein
VLGHALPLIVILNLLLISFGSLASAPPYLADLREQARLVVQKSHCGGCHTPGSPKVRERALKIYDLSQIDWSSSMNDRQLKRFESLVDSNKGEIMAMGGDPKANFLTLKERQALSHFLEAELSHRKRFPDDRFGDLFKRAMPGLSQILK